MKIIEPYTLAGFLELSPQKQIQFDRIKDTILSTYQKYGFFPLDTPVVEASEILLAKAGGETEKQIYRFKKGENDLCLRFDLTVPLAKYVAKNQGDLIFPFRRFQSGKVFRGEKPQKGRYREFYQCDIDVVGDENLSVAYDAEMPSIIAEIFKGLNLKFKICINNRKILKGLFESLNINEISEVYRIIDKIKKVDAKTLEAELKELKIKEKDISLIMRVASLKGSNAEKISFLENLNIQNETFVLGLEEIKSVINYSTIFGLTEENLNIDLSISRGLDYYTGTVYETFISGLENLGSVCSGGRYDDLAGFYSSKKFPGVGISVGLTRLFYIMDEYDLLPNVTKTASKVLFLPMDKDSVDFCFECAKYLRDNGTGAEVYLNEKKFKNKLAYADKLGFPFVAIIGDDEVKNKTISLKNMENRTQETLNLQDLLIKLK